MYVKHAFTHSNMIAHDFDQIIVQIRKILISNLWVSTQECGAQVIDDHNDIPKS